MFIAIGLGIFAGIVTALLSKCVNHRVAQEQFISGEVVADAPAQVRDVE